MRGMMYRSVVRLQLWILRRLESLGDFKENVED